MTYWTGSRAPTSDQTTDTHLTFVKTVSDRTLTNILSVASHNNTHEEAIRIPRLRAVRQSVIGTWTLEYERVLRASVATPTDSTEIMGEYARFQVAQIRQPLQQNIEVDLRPWISLLEDASDVDVDERILGYAGLPDREQMMNRGKAAVYAFLSKPQLVLMQCVCHGDLHHENVLRDETGLWFVDWDESYVGAYGSGVQQLLWEHAKHSGEPYEFLLRQAATIFNQALPGDLQRDEDNAFNSIVEANVYSATKELLRMLETMRAKGGRRPRAGAYLAAWGCRYEELVRARKHFVDSEPQ